MKKKTRETIETALRKHPERSNSKIRENMCLAMRVEAPATAIAAIRAEMGLPPVQKPGYSRREAKITKMPGQAQADKQPEHDPGATGISLRGVRVSTQKPAPSEGVKKKIYELKKGMGHPLDMLAAQWMVSEDTIRKHAKHCDAFRYVERGPGDWVACIVHPDTLKDN